MSDVRVPITLSFRPLNPAHPVFTRAAQQRAVKARATIHTGSAQTKHFEERPLPQAEPRSHHLPTLHSVENDFWVEEVERLLREELANQSGSEDTDDNPAVDEPEMLTLPLMLRARLDFEQNPQERYQRRPLQRLPRRPQPRWARAVGIGSLHELPPQPPPPFTHNATPFVFDGREFERVDFTLPQYTPLIHHRQSDHVGADRLSPHSDSKDDESTFAQLCPD
ncbi:hypothetical protein BLNAU_24600 [Blattamonas nauphoetae]|uniref:Uncharacterized protein n=1 Tax=Blattamonas nauphoetae TaxID=2049346 RepID=A0ABQ9WPT2_9EUKA|nr:hypothetical protein BLNAU_24600 [Blattamonas nauphoetae]